MTDREEKLIKAFADLSTEDLEMVIDMINFALECDYWEFATYDNSNIKNLTTSYDKLYNLQKEFLTEQEETEND